MSFRISLFGRERLALKLQIGKIGLRAVGSVSWQWAEEPDLALLAPLTGLRSLAAALGLVLRAMPFIEQRVFSVVTGYDGV